MTAQDNFTSSLVTIKNRIDIGFYNYLTATQQQSKSLQSIANSFFLLSEWELIHKKGDVAFDPSGLREYGAFYLNHISALDKSDAQAYNLWIRETFTNPLLSKQTAINNGISPSDRRIINANIQTKAKVILSSFRIASILSFLGATSSNFNPKSSYFSLSHDLFSPFGTILNYRPNGLLTLNNTDEKENFLFIENLPGDPILIRSTLPSITKFLTIPKLAEEGDNFPTLLTNTIDNLHPDKPIPNTDVINTMLMELFSRCEYWINIRKN